MHATRAIIACAVAALLAAGLLFAPPARADACTAFTWPAQPGMPSGTCEEFGAAELVADARISLRREDRAAGLIDSARLEDLRRTVIGTVAPAVANGLRSLGVGLPPEVNIVLVGSAPGSDTDPVYARTLPAGDANSVCYVLLFNHPERSRESTARTLAHELFHCVQYARWPFLAGGAESLWWREGSAVWFEDFALPALYRSTNLVHDLRLFRERSGSHSLLDNTYSNVVFFSWLGAERMVGYLSLMAARGDPQVVGATRALPETDYLRFAQDYVDERVMTPSGVLVAGDDYGPLVERVHQTTGVPGDGDPPYVGETMQPFTLARGEIVLTNAGYAPDGSFGDHERVFSIERAPWEALPEALPTICGRDRSVRFAAMSAVPAYLEVNFNTLTAGTPEAQCSCPQGTWSLDPAGSALDARVNARLTFNTDGTSTFYGTITRSEGPETLVTRQYEYRMRWHVDQFGLLNQQPEHTRRSVTKVSSRLHRVSYSEYVDGREVYRRTTQGSRVETWHGPDPDREYEEQIPEWPRPFECRGGVLIIGKGAALPTIMGGIQDAMPDRPVNTRARDRIIAKGLPAELPSRRTGSDARPLRPAHFNEIPYGGRYLAE